MKTPILVGLLLAGMADLSWAAGASIADAVQAGDSATVARLAGPDTRVIANGKALVAPGFMDGHAEDRSS